MLKSGFLKRNTIIRAEKIFLIYFYGLFINHSATCVNIAEIKELYEVKIYQLSHFCLNNPNCHIVLH